MTVSREQIIEEARRWLETRWVHQGRSEAGIDCAGLLIMIGNTLGLPSEDMKGYKRSPDGRTFREHIFRQTTHQGLPVPGSIGLFKETRFPTHTGIFAEQAGQLTLIHAYMPAGKVIEEPFIHHWPSQLVAVRNFIGLID